jgi:membrane-associated phospholipid phosphatase
LALWANRALLDSNAFAMGMFVMRLLDPFLIAGAVAFIGIGLWRIAGNAPAWTRRVLTAGGAAALALLVALALKYAVGRSQAYPTFLRDGVYGFRPLSGSVDYAAFPSATMAGVSALLRGARTTTPQARLIAVALIALLAAALIVTNGHWLGDIVGGTYLGLLVGGIVQKRANRGANEFHL